jgi:predicted dienelactone hydrolase
VDTGSLSISGLCAMTKVSSSAFDAIASRTLKSRLLRLVANLSQWGKQLFIDQQLPLVARKACEIYLDSADVALQKQCQYALRTRIKLNPEQVHQFLHTSMGTFLLDWSRHFFHWPSHQDPHETLKTLILEMATDSEGISLLTALRYRPESLEVNLDHLLFTVKRVEWLLKTTRLMTKTVGILAEAEAHSNVTAFDTMPDLRQPGPWTVSQTVLNLPGRPSPHTLDKQSPPLQVTCYAPQPWPDKPVPVIIQSHGLASSPAEVDLYFYAYHLASHGYFVAAPQHPGSDVQQVRHMLQGKTSEVFKRSEFINRPADISYLLDQLGTESPWSEHLNLDQVGVMGHSFGAYTAFALAGATIQFKGLEQVCALPNLEPNLSLLLQCQALALPRQFYQLHDRRIQAVMSLDSVGSEVFGRSGLAQIHVPVMLVSGSHDVTAPLALEQLRLFRGLTTAHQYLAVICGKSHLHDVDRFIRNLDLDVAWSPTSPPPTPPTPPMDMTLPFSGETIQALSVAFFDAYLRPEQSNPAYLSAAYGQYVSRSPYQCWLISDRAKTALDEQLRAIETEYVSEFAA